MSHILPPVQRPQCLPRSLYHSVISIARGLSVRLYLILGCRTVYSSLKTGHVMSGSAKRGREIGDLIIVDSTRNRDREEISMGTLSRSLSAPLIALTRVSTCRIPSSIWWSKRDLYRTGISIAVAIRSFDPLESGAVALRGLSNSVADALLFGYNETIGFLCRSVAYENHLSKTGKAWDASEGASILSDSLTDSSVI